MKGQLNLFEPEFIKDIDCTVDTPVTRGNKDKPIYGTGKRIKPRVPGRRETKHMEEIYLEELLPLEEYDLIVVLISGGKDSIATYFKLRELGAPKSRSVPRRRGWTVLEIRRCENANKHDRLQNDYQRKSIQRIANYD